MILMIWIFFALSIVKSFEPTSPHSSHLVHRPIPEHGFTVDKADVHRPKITAVVGHGSMVTQHKVAGGRDYDLGVRALVGVSGRNVVLVERRIVDDNLARLNADPVARQPDHAFGEARRVIG